ncbi:Mitotic-spindle organizing gamma-tubulin ring associated protein [Giardia duodenalis]|uniref:Mitotic-spindle organizing gamma-tubulin ring associated protein n=2 Tax=Giardia intestinalis TaxID=5741 RepID=C6LYJ0_GIAIB|nr:Hypothetical protein GL50581_3866 [Giardia intestinalis ATCC 50581]ESU43619.1 Mitotic-spindle organizing gamma-tubulin ring associated protein [Giardia intestinalis]
MPDLTDALIHIEEISAILNTGLSRSALACILSLCEAGANPEALAAAIREIMLLRDQAASPMDASE